MCKLLHVSDITGKSLPSALLHKTIVEVHKSIVETFRLFHAILRSLVMGQLGPKHVGVYTC
jgi:hypothetical protein